MVWNYGGRYRCVNTSPHINCSDIVLMHWMRVDALKLWSLLRNWKARALRVAAVYGQTGSPGDTVVGGLDDAIASVVKWRVPVFGVAGSVWHPERLVQKLRLCGRCRHRTIQTLLAVCSVSC
jgi:hypothetical protein